MTDIEFLSNSYAVNFYKKWRRDTLTSLFFASPLFTLLFIVLPFFLMGPTLAFFLFLIFPIVWIGVGFIYTPYFKRRNSINFIVKSVSVLHRDTIVIETFGWFSFKPIYATLSKADMEIKKSVEVPMLTGKEVLILKGSEGENAKSFYVVQDFFDAPSDLIEAISK